MKKTTYNLNDVSGAEAIGKGKVFFKAWREFHEEKEKIQLREYMRIKMKQLIEEAKRKEEEIAGV